VNGILKHHPDATLGVIPLGSGCDYARTFDIPQDVAAACARITSATPPIVVDAAEIRCRRGEAEHVRFFANIAEVGIGAEIVKRAERLPRRLGRGRYLVGFGLGLKGFTKVEARITLDGEPIPPELTNLIVANAQYFGGGMRIAPGADPTDGLFDVLVVKGTKRDYVAAIGKLYRGRHLPSPHIDEYRARRVEIETEAPLPVEADGELLGTTPATFRVVERALVVKA
jgi:YegS/Rv2252/BmrU family lipid kinase